MYIFAFIFYLSIWEHYYVCILPETVIRIDIGTKMQVQEGQGLDGKDRIIQSLKV